MVFGHLLTGSNYDDNEKKVIFFVHIRLPEEETDTVLN